MLTYFETYCVVGLTEVVYIPNYFSALKVTGKRAFFVRTKLMDDTFIIFFLEPFFVVVLQSYLKTLKTPFEWCPIVVLNFS